MTKPADTWPSVTRPGSSTGFWTNLNLYFGPGSTPGAPRCLTRETSLTILSLRCKTGRDLKVCASSLRSRQERHAVDRLLMYLARLWTEPGDGNSLPLSCVCGVIVDLTGSSPACDLTLHSAAAPGCRLELTVLRRNLAGEDGKALIARVASGEVSAWQLGWVPLMRGGNESAIIIQWRKQAEAHLTDEVHRADMGSLVLTFATLAGCRPAWDRGLKGWNMETSPFLDEIRAQGREIGRQEGRAEEARAMVMRFGRRKFGKGPTRKQQAALGAITDLDQLEQLADRVLLVDSWSNLLNGHTIS